MSMDLNERPFDENGDTPENTENNAPEKGEENIEDIGSENTADGSYSLTSDNIVEKKTFFDQPAQGQNFGGGHEYEYGFDSRSGKYSYSTSEPRQTGYYGAPDNGKKKKGKKNGGKIAIISVACALCLILSCGLGGVAGYLAGTYAGANSQNGGSSAATPQTPSDTVKNYTTVIENTADNQSSALTKAAEAAHSSVVIIDVYSSEEYEKVNQPDGSGSGVIWTSDGYIVTCNHVVEGASIVKVTLENGSVYPADIIGTDSKTDIAVIKISSETTLTPVIVRGADLVLAESVIAIGNPLGVLGGTVTSGIISSLERTIAVEGQSMTLLQTDAAINSGNSGGGLFDINGSLVGIVNAKSTGSTVEGIGYAIPINTVKTVANELIEHGYVTGRPQLGISVVGVTTQNYSYLFSASYYPELEQYATKTQKDGWGITRKTVVPGVYIVDTSLVSGYAEGSDTLLFGDKILYVGQTEIDQSTDVKTALSDYSAGDTISLTVLRDQKTTVIVKVILGQAGSSTSEE